MTVNFGGNVYDDAGNAVSGASVKLLETGTDTQEGSTVTTDSDGRWDFLEDDQDRYDVEITKGSSVRRIKWSDEISLQELDVRNNTGATTPAATFTNLTNSAANQVAVFSGANSTRADNDEIYLSFKFANSAGDIEEFARMTAVATDVTDGDEDGQFEFDVKKDGSLIKAFTISSSDAGAQSIDFNQDSITFGTGTAATDITLTFDAESADGVITWMEDEDYFKFSDDILMNSTEKIQFYDTAIYIYSSADGQLDLVADTEIQIAATTIDINGAVAFNGALTGITNITLSGTLSDGNYTFDTSGNVSGLGTVGSGAITSSGIIKTDDATEATSTADGSLQTDGGLSVVKDAVFGDDIKLLSDSAVIALGADGDTTLTHTDGTGLTLNSTNKLTFGDAATFIHQSSDGVMTVDGEATIDLNASTAVLVSNDLKLNSDSAVLGFGADNDTTLTHTDGTGLTLNSTNKLTFGDTGTFIHQSSDGVLTIESDTTVDINGSVDIDAGAIDGAVIGANSAAAGTFAAIAGTTIDATTDFTVGSTVITDDSIVMTPSASDTVTIAGAANGVLNITTVDAAAAAANIQITADGTAELAGTTVTLDASGDIALDAAADVNIPVNVGLTFGNDGEKIEGDGTDLTISGGHINLDPAYAVHIHHTSPNTFNGYGLTVNMEAQTLEILSLKSTSVEHAMTALTEEDTFGSFKKSHSTKGGLHIQGFKQSVAGSAEALMLTGVLGTAANTDHDASARAVVTVVGRVTNGTTGATSVGANGNVFGVCNNLANAPIFLVDAEGDLFADGSAASVYDAYDDAQLVRAFDQVQRPKDLIRSKWDAFVTYNERDLIDAGVLGGTVEDGGLINVTGLQRLHNGAIWQAHVERKEMQERMALLEGRLLAIEGGA